MKATRSPSSLLPQKSKRSASKKNATTRRDGQNCLALLRPRRLPAQLRLGPRHHHSSARTTEATIEAEAVEEEVEAVEVASATKTTRTIIEATTTEGGQEMTPKMCVRQTATVEAHTESSSIPMLLRDLVHARNVELLHHHHHGAQSQRFAHQEDQMAVEHEGSDLPIAAPKKVDRGST